MATPELDWVLPQGEDFQIEMTYSEGDPTPAPVNLTGFQARMDIKSPSGTRLYTFNSASIADVDPVTVGSQADDAVEIALGSDGSVVVTIDRSLTLPTAGVLYQQMNLSTPVTSFTYDIFLRNATGKQKKILKGTITVEESTTLWV